MKTAVYVISRTFGMLALAGAFFAAILAACQLAQHPTTCPWSFACTVEGVPMVAWEAIAVGLLLLIVLLIIGLKGHRQRNIYGQPVRRGRNYSK